jgi:hypothetical protein
VQEFRREAGPLGTGTARRKSMEMKEPIPAITDMQQLEQAGFSSEQMAHLFRVKALYRRGLYHEEVLETRHLEFVRWLYKQGRLTS